VLRKVAAEFPFLDISDLSPKDFTSSIDKPRQRADAFAAHLVSVGGAAASRSRLST
jgi:hypothetical protein